MFLSKYLKFRHVFVRPRFCWFFGLWKNEPGLPIWRRGNYIRLTKDKSHYDETWDYARVSSKWTEEGKKAHPILSRLFPPTFCLPLWLSFYIFNWDLMYKVKWTEDDFRFEFPPKLCLVFFGLCISVTAEAPDIKSKLNLGGDNYWEAILYYEYYKGNLEDAIGAQGSWMNMEGNSEYAFNPEFLKEPYKRLYYKILTKWTHST